MKFSQFMELRAVTTCGAQISLACREACVIAARAGCDVSFIFNDTPLKASPDTKPDDLVREYFCARAQGLDSFLGDVADSQVTPGGSGTRKACK